MKKISGILSIVALTTFCGFTTLNAHEVEAVSANTQEVDAVSTICPKMGCLPTETAPMVTIQKVEEPQKANNNFYNMGRGLTNVATCWMEVFRCMIYRNSQAPFWGFIAGAVEGSGMTAVRAFTGVTDILFVGFEPGNIFEPRFAEFVWQSPWIPEPKLQYKAPKLRQD